MLKWPRCGFHQKDVGTRYVQLVFLYPVVSSGHVVYSGASRAQNMLALFFMLEWDRYGFNKKRTGTHYTKLVLFCIWWDLLVMWCILLHLVCEMSTHYFSCSGGPGGVSIKSVLGHIMLNLCFCI
jgi:hypothetical protein